MGVNGDPYNALTRALFADSLHVGDLQNEHEITAHAVASESADGARIELTIGLAGGKLQECRFRVFGCPHLVAATEWLCRNSEGGTMVDLAAFRAADCMEPLDISVEKTGRILLLEDAIRLLTEQLDLD